MNRHRPPEVERRRRLLTRALPLAAIALLAFGFGAVAGVPGSPEKDAAKRFTEAWMREDFVAMHAELNQASQRQVSVTQFAKAYLDAKQTATLRGIVPDNPSDPISENGETVVPVPLSMDTIAFGRFTTDLDLPFVDGGIAWTPNLVFPGLQKGEKLATNVSLALRAPILARHGAPLAKGPGLSRTHPLGTSALDVTGEVGTTTDIAAQTRAARQGFPPGTPVGISGVEQAFNRRLAGRPGGDLEAISAAGGQPRILAHSEPKPGKPVRTTIDPTLQDAAVSALAGRIGGVAVLDARNGAVRALAGAAFSAPQPPGSTFKIITTTAALKENKVSLDDTFSYTSGINVGGRFISNAHGEVCGGDFRTAFAQSCNAVFAPLGPAVGSAGLVGTAELYGFNEKPTLYNAGGTAATGPPAPSIPKSINDDLDLGVSAIGQGLVLATPLEMASVAQTVANDGVRLPTPLVVNKKLGPQGARAKPVQVMRKGIANQLNGLMVGVVQNGTGIYGAIPEAQVAGKTGTAELGPKPGQEGLPNPEQEVDAWFTAFAPADNPKLVVAVLIVNAPGDGGTVAAPVAASVLSAGL